MDADARRPEIEELLRHSRWAWALAARLVHDRECADDVVQDAWVKALESPPTPRSPRGWLATVIRHRAAEWRRSESRRAAREHDAARPEALPPVDRALAREAARRTLVEAVLALEEPYRSTLLLRYFDELSPAAIAKREGVPASTVRNRLSRGLALLRLRLRDTRDEEGHDALSALALVVVSRLSRNTIPIGLLAMKKFHVVWVAVLALCGVGGGAWYAAHRAPTAVAPNASPVASVALAATQGERETAIDERAPIASDTRAADAAPTGHLVRVLDGLTRAPVARATVLYAPSASLSDGWARFPPSPSGDIERDLEASGSRVESDEHGEVWLPAPGGDVVIVARSDCSWGQARVGAHDQGPTEVLLEDDITLFARVVDERGDPVAGVPLALSRISASGLSSDGESWRTDAAGRAQIPHAQARGPFTGGELLLHFDFPTSAPGARVDLARSDQVLELTLPPTGALRIRWFAADGEPATGRHFVTAHVADTRSDTERCVGGKLHVVGSEGVFPFVELGRRIGVTVWPGELVHTDPITGSGAGPTFPGEEAILELRPSPRPRDLVVAVQDFHGSPLETARVAYELLDWQRVPLAAPTEIVTDEHACFSLARSGLGFSSGHARFLRVVRRGADGTIEQEGQERLASFERAGPDHGYVRLGPSRLLAAGRVLDASGVPRAGASVSLLCRAALPDTTERDDEGGGWVSLSDELRELEQLGYGPAHGPSDAWVHVVATRSRDDGSFELRGGELPVEPCALLASAAGAGPSELQPIEPGSTAVDLRLRAACSFSGRALVDAPDFLTSLIVSVSREPLTLLTPSTRDATSARVDRSGRFVFDAAPCAPIHVTVFVEGQLAFAAGVVDPAALGTAEYELDLRGRLFEHRIAVVDEAFAPLGTGSLRWRDSLAPEAPWREAVVVDGLARVRTPAPAIDVEARVDARRMVTREGVRGSEALVLPPACRLTAVLGEAFELAAPGLHVELWVHPAGVLGERGHDRELRGERSAEFWLQEPGEWIVEWYLADDAKRSRERLAWSSFDVEERTRELTTALEISLDEFARHRERLRSAPDK
ncbi:MAG: sigma-70 family RNA polymerase sigma factor [Planctomycetes bacterium]|nr:sigma-70 family RNA polymerase sigma factor [Planctomycetota bacterium]